MNTQRRNRALATLQGLAFGDALGMPTQSMSPSQIVQYYGAITGLCDSVPQQPIAPSRPAGSVTDDTEQALLLGQLLTEDGGHIDPLKLADALLAWEEDMIRRGSVDLLGPSTKLALEQVRRGADPLSTGRTGTTNGAAMRVAPIGIAFSVDDPGTLSDVVYESCQVTHDTIQGWESATLIAASISAGINGCDTREAIRIALAATTQMKAHGHWSPKASVCARLSAVLEQTEIVPQERIEEYLRICVGTSVESTESVPCALFLAYRFADNPTQGLLAAANLGGDTDTIAALAGAVLGATCGSDAFAKDDIDKVMTTSDLHLEPLVQELLLIRG